MGASGGDEGGEDEAQRLGAAVSASRDGDALPGLEIGIPPELHADESLVTPDVMKRARASAATAGDLGAAADVILGDMAQADFIDGRGAIRSAELAPRVRDDSSSVRSAELAPPDLLDSRGRLRRMSIAFVISVIMAALTYAIATQISQPDDQVTTGAYRFVYYMTALVGGGVFAGVLSLLNERDKRKWSDDLAPPARIVKSRDERA